MKGNKKMKTTLVAFLSIILVGFFFIPTGVVSNGGDIPPTEQYEVVEFEEPTAEEEVAPSYQSERLQ